MTDLHNGGSFWSNDYHWHPQDLPVVGQGQCMVASRRSYHAFLPLLLKNQRESYKSLRLYTTTPELHTVEPL